MPRTLLLVESPNKAKKIQGFLGRDGVTVRASVGHICDLPQKGYGVDLATFEESYEVRNPKVVGELRRLVRSKEYDRVLLATDPDREGEAIAWHLTRELKLPPRAPLRIEFREVTERALRAALAAPRPIDLARVDAQRSRRVLDRIVGFDVSGEICWPAGATSAGRVQTPALHILCEREREILAFEVETYWTLSVEYVEGFKAFVPEDATDDEDSERGAWSVQGAPQTDRDAPYTLHAARSGRLRPKHFSSREEAEATRNLAQSHPHVVRDVQRRRTETRPEPPYTTSTMQQDASRKLRLSAKQAADLAQSLFEAGYITYHRTDSTRVSDDAVAMARAHIAEVAPAALPAQPPKARGKAAGAQDAHEAIRPTKLTGDDAPPSGTERLYAMIKARFLASQCKPAVFDRTTIWTDSGPVAWVAQGAVLVDPGFLHFWRPYARQEDEELPTVAPGQRLGVRDYAIEEKQTTPPSRYDTGSLIRKLEVSGVGRPATFASIIETLLKRGYVHELRAAKGKVFLQPTPFGLQVDGLLTDAFPELVSEGYTAHMEGELDRIEHRAGETRLGFLARWYAEFRAAMQRALPRAAAYRVAHNLSARGGGRGNGSGPVAGVGGSTPGGAKARGEETAVRCDRCGESTYRNVARRAGRGSFLACPACGMTRDVRARVKPAGCPRCGSALIERRGKKKGVKFFGCVRYRAGERPCDYLEWSEPARDRPEARRRGAPPTSESMGRAESTPHRSVATRSKGARRARRTSGLAAPSSAALVSRTPTDKPCPRCGAEALVIVVPSGGGGALYSCSGGRSSCGFTLPVGSRRRPAPCPQCGALVLERRDEGGRPMWACARAPGCEYRAAMGS